MKKNLLFVLLLLSISASAQRLNAIDEMIRGEMKKQNIPALAVAVIDTGRIAHLSTAGYKNLERKWRADESTSFHIASVSKTVLTMAVFQLVESGKIDLDADINDYLSFKINNPHVPNDIITVKELLIHRSGILDNYELYKPYWNIHFDTNYH